jgi:hypothetical protein
VLLDNLAEAVAEGTRKQFMESVSSVPLLIIDDFGMRKLPHTAGRRSAGNHHAALRASQYTADVESSGRRLGKVAGPLRFGNLSPICTPGVPACPTGCPVCRHRSPRLAPLVSARTAVRPFTWCRLLSDMQASPPGRYLHAPTIAPVAASLCKAARPEPNGMASLLLVKVLVKTANPGLSPSFGCCASSAQSIRESLPGV